VLLIFIHECGHALAAKMRGNDVGFMLFIPLMGAFVTTKRYGRNIVEDAFIGIMGPIVGTLACVACVGIFFITHAPFWLALASWGFLINLFNLAPTAPLDGGWITPLFSPKLLAVGVVLLLFMARYNWLIVVLALLSIPRIISAWKADPRTQPYYQAQPSDRWKFGIAYLGLALFLALGQYSLNTYLHTQTLPFA
jgi:Zn-dependent protease